MTNKRDNACQLVTIAAVLCCGLLFVRPAAAQDADVLKSRVLTAVRQSSLVSPALKAYRLEGTMTLFDGAGRNPQRGTFEVLRNGEQIKVTVTFSDAASTFLTAAAGSYSSNHGSLPYYAAPLLRVVQTPLVFKGFGTAVSVPPKILAGNLAVECLPIAAEKSIVRGPVTPVNEVCIDRSDDLRAIVDGSVEFLRDDIFSFGGQRTARRVQLRLGGVVVGQAEITRLEAASFDEAAFAPTSDLKLVEKPATRISGSTMAGRIISHENPKYPGKARAAHIQGVVVLHAIIGTDGHITDLSVVSSPDESLAEASLKAVSKWTYEPYLLDGKPTAVETTITVNFAIGK